ncbi:MAG: hypothetical protein ABI547_01070 [Betaproteobacteria bacterium]
MSERPDNDVARDAKLTALYRDVARDAPPPALDAAILAAARREVGARPRPAGFSFARAWRGPLSVAAVVVLSVSLVMLMREEAPDVVAPPRADVPVAESKLKSSAATSENEAVSRERNFLQEEQTSKNLGLKPSHSMPQSGLRQPESMARVAPTKKDAVVDRVEPAADGAGALAKRRDAFADADTARKNRAAAAPEPQRQATKTDAYTEFAPPPPAAAPPRAAEPVSEKVAPAVGAIAGKVENQAAKAASAGADRGEADTAERAQSTDTRVKQSADAAPPPVAKPAPAPREIAPAAPAAAVNKLERNVDLTPEKWLERIEELRRQGKLDESRASLVEFRKRYPDYRLPESLRNGLKE